MSPCEGACLSSLPLPCPFWGSSWSGRGRGIAGALRGHQAHTLSSAWPAVLVFSAEGRVARDGEATAQPFLLMPKNPEKF